MSARKERTFMLVNNPEVKIIKKHDFTTFSFRRRNLNFKRYFSEFTDSDAFNNDTLSQLLIECQHKLPFPLHIVRAEINEDIEIDADLRKAELIETFSSCFLDLLLDFYENNEVHITRMFGSFVYIKRVDDALKAVHATPIPIKYCPLMKKLLTEIGGDYAEQLLAAICNSNGKEQSKNMCRLINEIVIKGGYFDTSRPLNSCEANVLFGASETMSSAFKSGLLDAAVIVSNNLGTIITTNESNTQGAVKRMTGLFLTSPSKEIMNTANCSGIIPVFPHTAIIDQLEGVKTAIALGYKKIAVSVAWQDNILLNDIKELEKKHGVTIYRFGLCSTGISDEAATAMENADIVWACASKAVKEKVEPNSVAQVGIKIPVHILSQNGWQLVKNHLVHMSQEQGLNPSMFDSVKLATGSEKPIILNSKHGFKMISKSELKQCDDCPYPCI